MQIAGTWQRNNMDEMEQTAPEMEAVSEETADPQDEAAEAEFTDGEEGGNDGEGAEPQPEEDRPKQTKEQNAEFARLRREKERREAEEKAYKRGKEEAFIGMENPFTGEEIKDAHDARLYLEMQEAKKRGYDPVGDFYKYQREQVREQEEAAKTVEQSSKRVSEDLSEFSKKYPDIDFVTLLGDDAFMTFADGKLEKHPLSEVYERFLAFKSGYTAEAQKTARVMVAKSLASPGALSGNGTPEPVGYGNMSDEEFEKVFERAKRGELSKS